MAREFAKGFYRSKAWRKTRQAYFRFQQGLCERCKARGEYKPGEIVHHLTHLSPLNINDPDVTLSFDNLELVCRDCHAEEHPEVYGAMRSEPNPQRVLFDENGNVLRRPDGK